ncbi:MAG: phosphate transport system regulatory protein PhoU [Pirellulaceae bacterium]|nr:MAG: phosphate transport system regulatory protein PhoU [Pirellulaceae bacterium]
MTRHFIHDLEDAYRRLLTLSGSVEQIIERAIGALTRRDVELAREVIRADEEIDQTEVRIEEECLKMLALHQPVATDLRRLTTMMKVNNDLEQIADLACGIAQRASRLVDYPSFPIPELIDQLAQRAVQQVRAGLNAFVNHDVRLSQSVIEKDDDVDELNVKVIESLAQLMQQDAGWIPPALECFSAARGLEQIADHAVNVAEDVIYMVDGVIVRHRRSDGIEPASLP